MACSDHWVLVYASHLPMRESKSSLGSNPACNNRNALLKLLHLLISSNDLWLLIPTVFVTQCLLSLKNIWFKVHHTVKTNGVMLSECVWGLFLSAFMSDIVKVAEPNPQTHLVSLSYMSSCSNKKLPLALSSSKRTTANDWLGGIHA